jgi:hypothetical protein
MKMHLVAFCISLFYFLSFTSGFTSVFVVPSSLSASEQDGSLEYPFSTIEQARNYFRTTITSSPLSFRRVALYPAYHFVRDHTLTFDERDHLTIYTKMTEDERSQVQLRNKQDLIELDFPVISGGIRLTDWVNDKGVCITNIS